MPTKDGGLTLAEKQKKYEPGIQLYRIVSMLLIIMFHFSDHGAVLVNMTMPLSLNWIILSFSRVGGALGNCAYVLISGYLLINKRFNLKRLAQLWLEVWFYSVAIGIVCFCTGLREPTARSVMDMLFPVTFFQYWYLSSYIVLFCLAPFINRMLLKLSRRQHLIFCAVTLALFSLIPTFTRTTWLTCVNQLPVFISLYALGGYVRRFDMPRLRRPWIGAVLGMAALWGSILMIYALRNKVGSLGLEGMLYFLWPMYKTPAIVCAFFLFMSFRRMKRPLAPVMYRAAESVFGVYLIHIGWIGNWLFKTVFNDAQTYNSPYLIVQLLAATAIIFVGCVVIDQLRILLVDRPAMGLLSRPIERLSGWLQGLWRAGEPAEAAGEYRQAR